MKVSIKILLGLFTFGWLAASLPAASSGSLAGRIIPPSGRSSLPPVIQVTLKGMSYQVTTFAMNERFSFENVPGGSYQVVVEAEGFQPSVLQLRDWKPESYEMVLIQLGPLAPHEEPLPATGGAVVDVRQLQTPESAQQEFARAAQDSAAGDTEKAIERLHKAVEIHPEYFEAYNNLGVIHLRSGSAGEAVEAFTKAAEIKPDEPLILRNLGYALLINGDAEKAVAPLAVAARIEPTDARTQATLGEALYQAGREEEAEIHLKTAVTLDPEITEASYRLGIMYAEQERYPEALQQLRDFSRRTENDEESPDVSELVDQLAELVRNNR
jgi:Flp pilus assembly protein TadD